MTAARTTIPPDLRSTVARLRERSGAEAIYLFGSRARGDHREASDWDLALIVPDDTPRERVLRAGYRDLVRGTGIEVHPIRRHVFERRKAWPGTLSRSIAEEGIALGE